MEICDNDSNCCQTADNLHYKFGDDRKRGSIDVYADVDLLGNCDNVGSTFKKKDFSRLTVSQKLGPYFGAQLQFICVGSLYIRNMQMIFQVGILVADPPVKRVALITNYQSRFTTNYQGRLIEPNWSVQWVEIKTASGDKFRCNVDAWIDQRSVQPL